MHAKMRNAGCGNVPPTGTDAERQLKQAPLRQVVSARTGEIAAAMQASAARARQRLVAGEGMAARIGQEKGV